MKERKKERKKEERERKKRIIRNYFHVTNRKNSAFATNMKLFG
jgi:hypothetical protein